MRRLKHMDKKQREERRRQEDKALNRGLLWVVGAVVLECLLLLVNRYYINFYLSEVETATVVFNILKGIRIVGAIAGVLCLAWAVLWFRKKKTAPLPVVPALALLALALCAHVTLAFEKAGVQMLFLLVPAWAGLALVYYLYQKEFFLAAVASGAAAIGVWFIRFGGGVGPEVVLCLVVVILAAAAALGLKKTGGVVRLDGQEIRLLPKNVSYVPVLASCAAGLAAVLAAAALGGSVSYYLIFVMAAWIFALLVYYTVKLM